jgi:hypothetical protein
MADNNPSISVALSTFHRVTSLLLGYDIDNEDVAIAEAQKALASKAIRKSWPTDGAPAWKVDEDITFLKLQPEDDQYNRQRTTLYSEKLNDNENMNETMLMTSVFKMTWSIYGPNSYINAMKIFTNIFKPAIMRELKANEMYPIPDISAPMRIPELVSSQWWERVELSIRFNTQIRLTIDVPYIKSVKITINEEKGDTEIVNVESEV